MPYLRQRSLTGIPASASFKIATIWLSVMRLLIVKLLCFSLKEILRVGCIILRGSYNPNYLPDADQVNSDIVNLGFVINVIEDRIERTEAIIEAWHLADKLLV